MTGSILIVDNDEDLALVLRDALRRRGFAADAVTSAPRALAYLATSPVEVVVTDVQMPGMSGLELCSELRARHADLLAIVLTGQRGPESAAAAIDAGAYEVLTKPLEVTALALAIGRALDHLAQRRAGESA